MISSAIAKQLPPFSAVTTSAQRSMTAQEQDLDLIGRMVSGDENAMRDVYAAYGQRLFAYALSLTNDHAAAEDVTQETLVIVWRTAGKFRGEGRLIAWLLGIVHHTAMKALRHTAEPFDTIEETLQGRNVSLEEQAQAEDTKRCVRMALQKLSTEHRTVLELVFLSGAHIKRSGRGLSVSPWHSEESSEFCARTFARRVEPCRGGLAMNHEEQLILYTANQLDEAERLTFEKHLADCAECQADLHLWKAVADEIIAADSAEHPPVKLAERVLERIHQSTASTLVFRRVAQLLRSQVFLVQREMWPATASVMALGVIIAFVSRHAELIYFIAPLISAASLSVLFGPEYDPAHELALSTATSSWKLLLARLSIVSAYNLILVLAALSILMLAFPPALLGTLALGILAPMTFLSVLALLLSIWIGTSNSIVISYILWALQFIAFQSMGEWIGSSAISSFLFAYRDFWHSPMLLLALSVPLLLITLWSANRPVFRLSV